MAGVTWLRKDDQILTVRKRNTFVRNCICCIIYTTTCFGLHRPSSGIAYTKCQNDTTNTVANKGVSFFLLIASATGCTKQGLRQILTLESSVAEYQTCHHVTVSRTFSQT
jgi:hypothetical protein